MIFGGAVCVVVPITKLEIVSVRFGEEVCGDVVLAETMCVTSG